MRKLLLITLLLWSNLALAQVIRCGTMGYLQEQIDKDPNLQTIVDDYEIKTPTVLSLKRGKASRGLRTVGGIRKGARFI